MRIMKSWLLSILLVLSTGACRIVTLDGTGPRGGGGGAGGAGGGGGGEGGGAGGGGGGSEIAAGESYGDGANHHLDADDVFVSDRAYASGWIGLRAAKQETQPTSTGEATFRLLGDASTVVTKHYWRTRAARRDELAVGAIAVMLDARGGDVYRAPKSRDEARKNAWFMARITSVSEVSRGYVQVAAGYLVALDAIRLVEGDTSPRVATTGQLDRQFLQPEHWLVSDRPLPDTGYISTYVAVAAQPPSKDTGNEGHFVGTREGSVFWTRHAWRTRLAERGDLRVGQMVFTPELRGGDVYRTPASHGEAVYVSWFAARITDTSKLYKGVVEVAGKYYVAVDAMRVPLD